MVVARRVGDPEAHRHPVEERWLGNRDTPRAKIVADVEDELVGAAPEGSARNVWETTVHEVDLEPGRVRVRLGDPLPLVAEVTPASMERLGLRPDARVWAALKATAVTVQRS